jgi:hypothetical protein
MPNKFLTIALVNLIAVGGLSIGFTILTSSVSALPKDGVLDREPKSPPTPTPRRSPQPPQDYPAGIKFLLNNSNLMQQVVTRVWNDGGKGITEQKIKETLNGKEIRKGVNIYKPSVSLGAIGQQRVFGTGNNQVTISVLIPGNDAEFKATTPTVFGSYADPSFRVGFNLEITLKLSSSVDRILVDEVNVGIRDANFRGSNAVGTLVESFGDFFTGGGFSRDIVSRINGDFSDKDRLSSLIKSAIGSVVPSNILNRGLNDRVIYEKTPFPILQR